MVRHYGDREITPPSPLGKRMRKVKRKNWTSGAKLQALHMVLVQKLPQMAAARVLEVNAWNVQQWVRKAE